jgi:hypothetical protein
LAAGVVSCQKQIPNQSSIESWSTHILQQPGFCSSVNGTNTLLSTSQARGPGPTYSSPLPSRLTELLSAPGMANGPRTRETCSAMAAAARRPRQIGMEMKLTSPVSLWCPLLLIIHQTSMD